MFTNIYSPLHQLKHSLRSRVLVKRDDLIDLYISGNKWRKLKYILKEVAKDSKNHIVTFGGAYSNHLVATAAACSRTGIKSTAFVRGEEVVNEMLALCRLFGMNLIFTDRESYKNKFLLYEKHFGDDPGAFFVNEGGASKEAVKGCSEIIEELPKNTTHLFCAAGTGTTAAGLLVGIQERKLNIQLHVVPVLKGNSIAGGGSFIEDEILKYAGNTRQVVFHTDYHFGGYARTQPQLIAFIKKFSAEEGILIDPVYTGKMFFAIEELLGKGYFKENDNIVALHTGGLLGIMGMKAQFS